VDSLTQAIGEKEYYYHGRLIENIKINNVTDGYIVNGWENDKHTSLSGLVDSLRNPKTEKIELINRYTRPLYVAVKVRDKVAHVNGIVVADLWIVNQVDLHGNAQLTLQLTGPDKKRILEHKWPVVITGGEQYGQLLIKDVNLPLGSQSGYYTVSAVLKQGFGTKASGDDQILAVDWKSAKLPTGGAILDSNEIPTFLAAKGVKLPQYSDSIGRLEYVIIGDADSSQFSESILTRVHDDGTTAIIVGAPEVLKWTEILANKKIIQYNGAVSLGGAWIGGSLFVGENQLFAGLPMRRAFSWEYQLFANRPENSNREWKLRKDKPQDGFADCRAVCISGANITTIVGAQNASEDSLATAVCSISYGKGKILLSTLDILPYLNSDYGAANTVKKLFCNYLQYTSK
jgi:beta-galactosidase